MSDIKSIIAKNIVALRQASGMTQLELATKLNYSDKAVSKWEHADSMPDVGVLVQIADLFGVPLDYLVRAEHEEVVVTEELPKPKRYSRKVITAISVLSVWFVAMLFFVALTLFNGSVGWSWMCFIYALPVQTIVWLVLNSIWFNPKRNYLIISFLMWTGLLAIYLTLLMMGIHTGMIFLLGIPAQLIILLWSIMRKKNPN